MGWGLRFRPLAAIDRWFASLLVAVVGLLLLAPLALGLDRRSVLATCGSHVPLCNTVTVTVEALSESIPLDSGSIAVTVGVVVVMLLLRMVRSSIGVGGGGCCWVLVLLSRVLLVGGGSHPIAIAVTTWSCESRA